MHKKKLLVTGSGGLIGSEVVEALQDNYDEVYGIDNNQRKVFFGENGDTTKRQNSLIQNIKKYKFINIDIRERTKILELIKEIKPNAIVHCAAQPSHDLAASIPFEDFDTNAVGTLNLLEATRLYTTETPFVYLSTNKVYGDLPNLIALNELNTRYDFADPHYSDGISESFSIDQSKHSLFGASKVAADIMVQEYGRYFGMYTCCLRGGCLTGPNHSGVELHGFLNYLVKANLEGKRYTIFGYKGKQVRDNIHARDVANFVRHFLDSPRISEVYNIGGGKSNSISIIEAIAMIESISGIKMNLDYSETARIGDHICYYSDLKKIGAHYPEWKITTNLENTIDEIIANKKRDLI